MRRAFGTTAALFLALVAVVGLAAGVGFGALKFPKPQGYVNDFAGMLSPDFRQSLETRLADHARAKGSEIAVVTVDNLQGTSVEDFAVRLFEEWKIGKDDKDNGVLLLVAEEERKVRIEVGYGLEGALTDVESSRIIRDFVTPAFKAGDFDAGVREGVDLIARAIAGEETPSQPADKGLKVPNEVPLALLGMGLFFFIGLVQWVAAVLARSKSWWAGGVVGFAIGLLFMLFGGVIFGSVVTFALTFLGLALDHKVSKGYKEHQERKQKHDNDASPPWWMGGNWGSGGGWFGGGSDSGGGFGGFGGGGSGGGGASGDW
ncbi:MAG: TPM domain-containing protein [Candidatus Aquicultorales bacterium]